jgi:hypothetical protein
MSEVRTRILARLGAALDEAIGLEPKCYVYALEIVESITKLLEDCNTLAKVKSKEGLYLPGWTCSGCGVFNGEAKEPLIECRGCGGRKTYYYKPLRHI